MSNVLPAPAAAPDLDVDTLRALDQTLRIAEPDEAWFWATHAGAELDLLMVKAGRRVGV